MTASAFADLAKGQIQPDLLAQVALEVEQVNEELSRQVDSSVVLVSNIGKHTLKAGGKRLRPAFVSLSAKATGLPTDPERLAKLGACMEMIHMATLIHDDVIDNAATRRGRETASAVYGSTPSILVGDTLLAKAMAILAEDGQIDIIRNVSQAVVEMAEGEVRELETRDDFDLSEEDHMQVLRMKTASFIESCCEVGALSTGAPDAMKQVLGMYGHHIGMAFQVVDDLLDYRGDKAMTGKPQATDFREGCATLPLIYLRPLLSGEERALTREKFGNGVTDDDIRLICGWMDTRGAFELSEGLAREHAAKALKALEPLPHTPARELLETVAQFVILRQA